MDQGANGGPIGRLPRPERTKSDASCRSILIPAEQSAFSRSRTAAECMASSMPMARFGSLASNGMQSFASIHLPTKRAIDFLCI